MYIQHQCDSISTSSYWATFCNFWVWSSRSDFASGHTKSKDSFEIVTKPAIDHMETGQDSLWLQPCFTGREFQPIISSSSNVHSIH